MPAAVSIPMAAGQHQRQQHHRRMSSAGSPMSFKMAGSYGSYGRPAIYPAACSPSQLLGPLDVPDFMMALSTSLESTSISDSLHRPRPELSSSFKRYAFEHLATPVSDLDFCRNYQCCGIALNDLHALVEHFEEVHVQVILDDDAQQGQDNSGASSNGMLDTSGASEGAFQLDEDDIDMDLEEEDSSESSGSLPGTPNGPVSAGNHNHNHSDNSVAQYAASWMQPPTSAFESASVFASSSGGASSARSAPASRRPSPRTSPLLSTTSDGTHRSLTMPPAPSPDSPTYLSAPFSATSSAFVFSSNSPYASGPSTPLASGASTPVRSEYFSYAAANPMLGATGGAGGNTTPPGSASHHHPLALGSYLNFHQVQRSHSLPAGSLGLGTSTALLNGHSPLTPFADSPYSAESAFGDIDGPTHTLTHHHHPHAHHHHHSLHHHHQQAFAQYNLHHSHHHHGGSQSPLILGGGADSPLGGADSLDGEPNCITPAALVYSSSNPPPPSQTPTPANVATNGDAKGSLPPPPTVKVSKTSTKSAETLLKEGGVMLPSGFVLSPERAERLAQLERGVERTDRPPPGTKPFRCPTPMCTKSYKQANGLKYHITHGQCSFLPPDPELGGLSDREADERMRPFVCAVGSGTGGKGGGCGRRYKNMNGLRYHYQHSGAHGAAGLAMLAAGTHPQPPVFPKSGSSHHHRSSDPSVSSSATPSDSTGDDAPIAGGSRSQPASRPGSSQGKVRAGGAQRGTSATRSSRGSPGTVSASNSRPPSRAASVMAAHSHYVPVPMGVGVGGVGMGMGVGVGMDFSHHQPYGGAPPERMQHQHQQPYGAYGAQFEMEFGLVEGAEGGAGAGATANASQQQTTAGGSTATPTYLMGTTSVVPTTAMPISMKAPLSMSIKPPTTAATATPVGRPIPPMKSSSSSLAGALDLATSIKK